MNNFIIEGILSRTKYTVEVRSRNAAGWSSTYSERITTPMSDGPPPPTNIHQEAMHANGSATYTWNACQGHAGQELVEFEMQALSDDGLATVLRRQRIKIATAATAAAAGRQQRMYCGTINDLPPNQRLLFVVKVKNIHHWSNVSVPLHFHSKAPRFPDFGSTFTATPPLMIVNDATTDGVTTDGVTTDGVTTTTTTKSFTTRVHVDPHLSISWMNPVEDGGIHMLKQEVRVREEDMQKNKEEEDENKRKENDDTDTAATNTMIFSLHPDTRTLELRGVWPDAVLLLSIRGRNRRGWGKWSKPTLVQTLSTLMPYEKGAIVEAWWEGPWMRKDGFYRAEVIKYINSSKKNSSSKKEGTYTLRSLDYPDIEFQAGDHQVRVLNAAHGVPGKLDTQQNQQQDLSSSGVMVKGGRREVVDMQHLLQRDDGLSSSSDDDDEYDEYDNGGGEYDDDDGGGGRARDTSTSDTAARDNCFELNRFDGSMNGSIPFRAQSPMTRLDGNDNSFQNFPPLSRSVVRKSLFKPIFRIV